MLEKQTRKFLKGKIFIVILFHICPVNYKQPFKCDKETFVGMNKK